MLIPIIHSFLFVAEIVLFFMIFITAIYGPRSWLKISAILALVAGMLAGFLVTDGAYYPSGFYLGLILAIFGGFFTYWTGYWVRKFRGC